MNEKQQAYNNFFAVKKLVKKLGNQNCSLSEADAYTKSVELLKVYGTILVGYYPNIRNVARVVGYDKISKKMIQKYKS